MEISEKFAKMIKTISDGFQISEEEIKRAIERSYKYLGNENRARLEKVFAKAKKGEKIVFAGIGGSITEAVLR